MDERRPVLVRFPDCPTTHTGGCYGPTVPPTLPTTFAIYLPPRLFWFTLPCPYARYDYRPLPPARSVLPAPEAYIAGVEEALRATGHPVGAVQPRLTTQTLHYRDRRIPQR